MTFPPILVKRWKNALNTDLYSLIPFKGFVTFDIFRLFDYSPNNGTFGTILVRNSTFGAFELLVIFY